MQTLTKPQGRDGFFTDLWKREREFTLHATGDVWKTVAILGSLTIFKVFIAITRWFGVDQEHLKHFESLHFAFMYAAMAVTGFTFVITLGVSLWRRKQ